MENVQRTQVRNCIHKNIEDNLYARLNVSSRKLPMGLQYRLLSESNFVLIGPLSVVQALPYRDA